MGSASLSRADELLTAFLELERAAGISVFMVISRLGTDARDYCRSKTRHWESPVVRTHRCQMDRREKRSFKSITKLYPPIDCGGGIFNALTKVNKISTLVSEKHFNPRAKSEVSHGRCRAQTKAPPVLFYSPYYLSKSRSCADFQRSPFRC